MRVNGTQIRFSLSSGAAEHSRDQPELPDDFSLAGYLACPFRIMFTASLPAIVRHAAQKERKPWLAFTRRLMARMILFQDIARNCRTNRRSS
jgi:hypothetical protein